MISREQKIALMGILNVFYFKQWILNFFIRNLYSLILILYLKLKRLYNIYELNLTYIAISPETMITILDLDVILKLFNFIN